GAGVGPVARAQPRGPRPARWPASPAVATPEVEPLLSPPHFARIAASAAAMGGKPVVSCETFTCLYGFPAVHLKEEQTSDLRLLADAAIAHGVKQVVWHGMPYNPPGGSDSFFATDQLGTRPACPAGIP